ncbi:hypothetical protein ARMGADRAFT_1013517 [Armillaria gallica]|uniref:Uncharacterized protein n=1 Tax=Armillaria gallica TaxID=47427 RepID=A0A2H3DAN0_ARMGA|nr:hypothetical protein ARMGADRAFT_1013517 [Armillaria gallica]
MTHTYEKADKRMSSAMCITRPATVFAVTSRSTEYYEVINTPADKINETSRRKKRGP